MSTVTRRPFNVKLVVLAAIILVPACLGFAFKFSEFLSLLTDEEGAFTVMPVVNYLLATLGFFMLFGWAMLHGMFRDIERPKQTMLENERKLDEMGAEDEEEAHEWA